MKLVIFQLCSSSLYSGIFLSLTQFITPSFLRIDLFWEKNVIIEKDPSFHFHLAHALRHPSILIFCMFETLISNIIKKKAGKL